MSFVNPVAVSIDKPPSLLKQAIHIWIVRVPNHPHLMREQREYLRHARCKILAGYLGCPHKLIAIDYLASGQPRLMPLQSGEQLYFSTSYTGAIMALAVSAISGIGIDIEEWGVDGTDIVENFFSNKECVEWKALKGEDRREAFYRAWTLKEAYLKACGTGLSGSLKAITVNMNPRDQLSVSLPEMASSTGAQWFFESNRIDHILTVSVAVSQNEVDVIWLQPNQKESGFMRTDP